MRGLMLFACGCNQVFGLGSTGIIDAPIIPDAAYFDAPADAAPMCPAAGLSPPFRRAFVQVPAEGCTSYVPSVAGNALALCGKALKQGPADGALSPAMFPAVYAQDLPRVAPEGDLAILAPTDGTRSFDLFRRQPDETWVLQGTVVSPGQTRTISTPSRGPDRRAITAEFDTDHYQLTELTDPGTGAAWIAGLSYSANESGLAGISSVTLTADGLRLVVRGVSTASEAGVFIATRSALGMKFGMAVRVGAAPEDAITPFMTEDCGRIYFSGLGTVFYLSQ